MSVEYKARVTYGPGHDDVAVFVATEPEKWALAGTLRPRHGDESDALLRRLERGMRVEGVDREVIDVPTSSDDERSTERALRSYVQAIAHRLGVTHAHIGPPGEVGSWAMDTPARVENVGEDCLAEVTYLRRVGAIVDAARTAAWAFAQPDAGGKLEVIVEELQTALTTNDVRNPPPTRAARRRLTLEDVAAVCEAAGLPQSGRGWGDDRVIVETVTTSCLPIGPGDPRPFVGIFVWSSVTDRREDLTTSCSPALLRAVIDDVRAYPGE